MTLALELRILAEESDDDLGGADGANQKSIENPPSNPSERAESKEFPGCVLIVKPWKQVSLRWATLGAFETYPTGSCARTSAKTRLLQQRVGTIWISVS